MVLGELEEEEILTAYQSLSELIAGCTKRHSVQVQGCRKAGPLLENIFFNMFSSISYIIELLILLLSPQCSRGPDRRCDLAIGSVPYGSICYQNKVRTENLFV